MKNKLTIADIAEILGKKKAKYEKLANSKDRFENNTAKLKLGKIDSLMNDLFNFQEAFKPKTNNYGLSKAKYGWPPNYWEIGDASNYMVNTPENPFPKKQFKNTKVGQALSNPNVQAGIGQGLGMLGDYINQIGAINRTDQPDRVATVPKVRLNKNMDTSDLKRQAVRALRASQMQANQSGNTNVSNAVRSDLLGAYFDQLGKINSAENNYRMQMENSESQQNAAISAQNAMILNELYATQNQFANNKTMAKANALSGLLTKGQMMVKDYRDQQFDRNVRLPLMSAFANQQSRDYMNQYLPEYWRNI